MKRAGIGLLLLAACHSADKPQPQATDRPAPAATGAAAPAAAAGRSATARAAAQAPTPAPAAAAAADTTAAGAFVRWAAALRRADTAAVNGFISPAHGLWVLEQPGALPLLTRVTDVRRLRRHSPQTSFFSLAAELMPCPRPEPVDTLPTATCNGRPGNAAGFARTGCLLGPSSGAALTAFWPHATLVGGSAAQGRAAVADIRRAVLQTATGYRFHWARRQGRWWLVLVDLRVPCSA